MCCLNPSFFRLAGVWLMSAVTVCVFAQSPASEKDSASVTAKLDESAYFAFAANNMAELERLKAAGAEPARFARDDPRAIFDAVSEERSVDVLRFVLKSGANPNARLRANDDRVPIKSADFDLEKIGLLLKAGANINANGQGNDTLLARALRNTLPFVIPKLPRPERKQQVYTKLQVVQFLVDNGANFNGATIGYLREGALGMVMKKDQDVLDYLIARGATLISTTRDLLDDPDKPLVNRGPLTIALRMYREDIALKLLRRDKRIATNDGTAILEATRRNYAEVAMALLQFGADPNVSDDSKTTPLMWARKIGDNVLVSALLKSGAQERSGDANLTFAEYTEWSGYERQVAKVIDEVAFLDFPRFAIDYFPGRGKVNPSGKLPWPRDGVHQIECEKLADFPFIAEMNSLGQLTVGVCKSDARFLIANAQASKAFFDKAYAVRIDKGPKSSALELKNQGWVWEMKSQPGGATSFEFPFTAGDYGPAAKVYMLANESQNRVVVLIGSFLPSCDSNGRLRSPLCTDRSKAFAEIAKRVSERVND